MAEGRPGGLCSPLAVIFQRGEKSLLLPLQRVRVLHDNRGNRSIDRRVGLLCIYSFADTFEGFTGNFDKSGDVNRT